MIRAEYLGQRPHWLPLDSQEDIQNFENCPDSDYHSVVGYLHQLGGHSLREAVRACFDDALSGTVALTHTWTGIRGTRPLYNTRIVRAIYEATLRSASYPKGTKADFADAGKAALKAAKQRTRPSASVPSADALAVTDARACWTGRDDDDDDETTTRTITATTTTTTITETATLSTTSWTKTTTMPFSSTSVPKTMTV
ncbi:uncharacterized protein LOC143220001 [Lasioglossum baleicum]|uniref:uncharacterized protein LOC143220001 n=1 Tax=Lasioglossum baleicum TaxID=434251 RepID=UPI003FCDE3FC